jgi:hypothetical protein
MNANSHVQQQELIQNLYLIQKMLLIVHTVIPEYINIETTEMEEFNFQTKLMFSGAYIGLWLALRVVQFMEVFLNFIIFSIRQYEFLKIINPQN